MMSSIRARVFAVGALVALVSVPAHAQATAHAAAATPASVRVTVVRSAQSTPQRTVLAVRVDGRGLVLGSYEGNLSFDPAAFALDSAIVGRDGSRFVNAGAAKTGAVRFAGFTTTGFTSADAITLIGRALKPLEQSHVTASITVAGDLDGRKVPKAGLIGATGITAAR